MVKHYSETETDPETETDLLAAIKKQKDQLESTKQKGKGNENKASTFNKRFIVSVFITALYVLPMNMGSPFWILN